MLIGYARVSTDEQSLNLQIDALEQAGCDRIFSDTGFSGALTSRPALDQVVALLQPGDTLVTWRLDRLGRSLGHLIGLVAQLENKQVTFKSLSDAIDTRTAGGRLQFHMLGALAEFERSLISERTRAGMAAARARGVRIGRPSKLGPAEINVAIAHAQYCRLTQLADHFEVSVSTVRRAIAARRRVRV